MSEMDRLKELQACDLRVKDLERELRDIPARKAEETRRLEEHKTALAAAEEALKHVMADIKALENEAGAAEERVTKLRQQQMSLKSNDEFRAMETQIAAARGDIRRVEDKELNLMETVEQARGKVEERRRDLVEEEEAVAADVAELDGRMAVLEKELGAARAARDGAAAGVSPEWTSRFEAIAARRTPALVALRDGVCGGCHMKLPPSVHQNVLRGDGLVACDHCGRLLYSE